MTTPQNVQRLTTKSGAFDAAGTVEVNLGPVPVRMTWRLERITVACTGDAVPRCYVYLNSVDLANLLDATYTGNQDVSDFTSPLPLLEGSVLVVRWQDGTPGEVATVNLFGEKIGGA